MLPQLAALDKLHSLLQCVYCLAERLLAGSKAVCLLRRTTNQVLSRAHLCFWASSAFVLSSSDANAGCEEGQGATAEPAGA